jgi:hypothetical protein
VQDVAPIIMASYTFCRSRHQSPACQRLPTEERSGFIETPANTRSNGSIGKGQSSKADVTTCTVGNAARLRRATAAISGPSSTATTPAPLGEWGGGLSCPATDLQHMTIWPDARQFAQIVE